MSHVSRMLQGMLKRNAKYAICNPHDSVPFYNSNESIIIETLNVGENTT